MRQRLRTLDLDILAETRRIDSGRLDIPVYLSLCGRDARLAIGNRKHERSLLGHGGKRAGEKTVKKQGKRQKLMLTCPECSKKTPRVLRGRTKKKVEIQR